jgi:hypothetical protein
MTGTRFTLVGVLAVALATTSVGQEGGFNPPLNAEPVIPYEPRVYLGDVFVFELLRPGAIPWTPPDLSYLMAGGFESFCARVISRPAGPILPAQQLHEQFLVIREPFRPAAEESSAKNILLGSGMKR